MTLALVHDDNHEPLDDELPAESAEILERVAIQYEALPASFFDLVMSSW